MAKKKSRSIGKFFSRTLIIILLGYIVIMVIAAIVIGILSFFSDDVGTIKLADGFTIEAYNVTLNVGLDNKIDVTETITTNFTSCYKHGIYKFTPLWLEYTGKDGNTIKRKSVISNYRAIGDPYSLDTVKRKSRIKIGSANEYVGCGEKKYTIAYTYDMGKDPFKNFDELIFHAYGDYWGTEIKNATINVNMPKSIDGDNVNFFMDKYRTVEVTKFVDYTVNGNKLTAKFNQEKYKQYQIDEYCSNSSHIVNGVCDFDENYWHGSINILDKSLTVDIQLPEGYFVGGSWNYGWKSFIISMIIFLLTAWTIYKWVKFGKDYNKKAQTVEFYPPDNLSAAEIGYVFNKRQTSKKLTISLIIQLASKGYIKIDDLKDKNQNIQITNLVPKPKEPIEYDKTLPKRTIEVKKIKNADEKLSKTETTMMTYLFKKGDTKSLQTNIDNFLEVKDKLINDGYIEILSDNEKDRYVSVDENKNVYDKLVQQYNQNMKKYGEMTSKMPTLSSMERIVYNRLFENEDVIILSEHKTFYKAFNDVENELNAFKDKVHDKQATKQIGGAIFRNIIILILNIISYCLVEDLDPNWKILYILSFLCIFINLFFTIFMKRKNEYGELITARVKGFRHFLITAEKPRLEALVAENPHYFYNILPYTYAMNISKKWIKKFENIPLPKMDMGSFNYNSDYSYYSLYDNVYYPEPAHHSSSSSSRGCSSCGGGCSSCGGGCSSCGGGGSW